MKFKAGDCVKVIADSEKLHAGMTATIVRECKDEVSYWIYAFENSRYQGYMYVTDIENTLELIDKEPVTREELGKYARGEITHAGLLHYHPLPVVFTCCEKYEYTIDDIHKFLVKYNSRGLKPNEIEKWFTFVIYNVYDCYQTIDFFNGTPKTEEEKFLFKIFNEMDLMLGCASEYAECSYFDMSGIISEIESYMNK